MSLIGDRNCRALMALLVAASIGPAAAGDVYRWTDANGQVHYGTRPPHDATNARSIAVPNTAVPQGRGGADGAQRRERQRRLLDAYAYEREQKKAAAAEAARHRQHKAQRCRAIQAQWRRLTFAGPVYIKRDDGTRDFLSDEQRAAELAGLRPAYVEACGKAPD